MYYFLSLAYFCCVCCDIDSYKHASLQLLIVDASAVVVVFVVRVLDVINKIIIIVVVFGTEFTVIYALCDRDVEDSLDSLLEDAGLEGAISEDGRHNTRCCLALFQLFGPAACLLHSTLLGLTGRLCGICCGHPR